MSFISPTDPPLDGQFGPVRPATNILDGQFGDSGVVIWTPATLYDGDSGAWYDCSDLTTMWQDAAGTTPAAVDSPVGLQHDKSGNGRHRSQSTAGSRPTLRSDGTLYWLEYDGIDDYLQTLAIDMTGTAVMSVCVGRMKTQDAATARAIDCPSVSSNASWYMGAPSANGLTRNILLVVGSGGTAGVTDISAPANDADVYTGEVSLTAPSVSLRKDGASVGTSTATSGGVFSNAQIDFGRRTNGTLYFEGNEYQSFIIGRAITTDERTLLEAYIADKTGVTL